jgi:hypothetical protein
MTPGLRALPGLNHNYDPPRPWTCATHEKHDCDGRAIGALGAVPVCAAGATAEAAARDADQARIAAWLATPEGRRAVALESAAERRIEARP